MLSLNGMDRLKTTLCGIEFQNPIWAASGTFGYGVEFVDVADLNAIGGVVVKGLSREPIRGNPPPRLCETEGGMINSIGLQNIGARAFVTEKLPAAARIANCDFGERIRIFARRLRRGDSRARGR